MHNSATLLQTLLSVFCAILFALSGMGGGDMIIGDCYECWLYSNGEVVRHYIPCVRIADNAVGFYEGLIGEFITHAGFSHAA